MKKKLITFGILTCLMGCQPTVKVEPSDKPITVNLNLNVEHKLTVKMRDELDRIIRKYPDLFKKFKESQTVCERTDGLLSGVDSLPADLKQEIAEINQKRQEIYKQLDDQNKATPGTSAKAAALKLRSKNRAC